MTECDQEEKESFKTAVLEISNHLSSTLKAGLTDDDPQDEAIKTCLTLCAGFLEEEFGQFMGDLIGPLI